MSSWSRSSMAAERPARRPARVLALLAALTVAAALASLCLGATPLSPAAVWGGLWGRGEATAVSIVRYVRLPRTFGCLLAGAALAASGAIIQGVMANPLAAPNIIGVNAGAGFLVTLCGALAPGLLAAVPAAAFVGAFLGVVTVLVIAEKAGAARITLVLAGVAVSGIFSAGTDAVVTFFPDALLGYSSFRIGGLAGVTMARLLPAFWVISIALALSFLFRNELDLLLLGSETAQSLGLPVRQMRLLLLALAAALAGAAVSFAGLIGFVGLIVPHLLRRFVGEQSLFLLGGSALGGALLLTVCDVAARTLFAPYELPVGVVLSLVGGPFFLFLLLHQRGGRHHDRAA